jgi:hypothetical protein
MPSIRLGGARSGGDPIYSNSRAVSASFPDGVLAILTSTGQVHMTNADGPARLDINFSHRQRARRAALALIILWFTFAMASGAVAATMPTELLTGRFVARAVGPPLTSFGENHEYYIFELASPIGQRFVILSYKFLLYQGALSQDGFDYSHMYTFKGEQDEGCANTLEDVVKQRMVEGHGEFLEIRYALTYSKNVPSLILPWKTRLSCYRVHPLTDDPSP